MKKKILAFCDSEKDYLESMTGFLKDKTDTLFELHTYTQVDKMIEAGKQDPIELLLIAEADYSDKLADLNEDRILVLNESGTIGFEGVRYIDKYQKAELVWQKLLSAYAEMVSEGEKRLKKGAKARVIGLYSPVRRCLQTSFALTLGMALAEHNKVLYISFEHYAGWNQLLDKNVRGDLAALLYFVKEQEEKFACHLQSMALRIGKLYYIPPVYAGQNLIYVQGREWQQLIGRIAEEGGFDYLILDLSESIQGTFELLRMCDKIYTIIREDEQARNKLAQYEELLAAYEYEDVLEKTNRRLLPGFSRLPERIEQYTRGELAEYVQKLVREEL